MKKIIVLVFLFLASINISFSQNPSLTKTIKIYDTDSASVYKFFKINLPQTGYKNLYIQLNAYNQGYVIDPRYKNIYRLNYQTNIFQDNFHHGILKNVIQWGTYGWETGYAIDFSISPIDTNLILCGYVVPFWEPISKVFYTRNNGDTTFQILSASMSINFLGATIDPVNDSIMYFGYPNQTLPGNIFKSTNRGLNWIGTDTISSPSVEGKIYVNPLNRNIIFLINNSIMYRSTSAGYDFQSTLNDTITGSKMSFYVPDNAIYLVCPTNKGILKSTNNGSNWVQIFNKPCKDLEIDPLNANIFYAGTGEGIYKSTNKGTSWFLYNNTFSPSKNVLGIVKNPNTGDTLYAVTNKAVYKVFGQAVVDTITPRYFPLAVGNVYKYHYAASNGFNYDYKVRIIKDTNINSKKYFVVNRLLPAYIGNILRYDSLSGNIYNRTTSGYCSYSPFEELIDSLPSKKSDTTIVCVQYVNKHICNDSGFVTLFGNQVSKKGFSHNTSETNTTVTYGKNFGIISVFYSDFWGMAGESLIGCYINGVLYGDTSDITYTVSGSVKYSDNNQPVTSGWVKAIKLDKNTANIIVLDSAQIQSNGSYTLTKVPQDSVDIGIYPNSTPPNDWVISYYPSTIYWQDATTLYPTGNLTNINIGAIRMTATTNNNSVNGKVMRLTDNLLANLKDAVLYAKSGNTFVRCAMSDGYGVYHLNSLPIGNLKIIVNRLGFSSDSTMVNVTSTSNIDSINFYLNRMYLNVKKIGENVPSEYKLYQNYPNPFNSMTNVKWQMLNAGNVKIILFDILGKEVTTLVNEKQLPGVYEVMFDASYLPSGIYFYKLEIIDPTWRTQSYKETKRMVLIK